MARPIAADYDDKRAAILKTAAQLFAEQGYDRASMSELALLCGVSKALLYHYYDNKEHLLFDIIRAHLDDLVAAVSAAAGETPQARLRAMIAALLDAYRDADHEHQVQISALKRLPPGRAEALRDLERVLVRLFSAGVGDLHPALKANPVLLKPVTMNLFGMLNWKFMWFRENGPLARETYIDLVMVMLREGARDLEMRLAGQAASPSEMV